MMMMMTTTKTISSPDFTPAIPHHSYQSIERTRPAFEKLLIGPAMVFGEMVTGGHYLEVLRLGKQMTVGTYSTPSYYAIHQTFVQESGGLVPAFYRGFFPWGLIQCAKGIPVLFVQHESMYQLQARAGWTPNAAEKASGFISGASQAFLINPFQKLMVTAVASNHVNSMPPMQAYKTVISENGILSLFDGLLPHVLRRSLAWGICFAVAGEVRNALIRYHHEHGGSDDKDDLKLYEMIGCGIVGGAVSALTHPIDNIMTNAQKPLPAGSSRDLVSVALRMHRESGYRAFTRGWGIRIVDNAYHVAWVYGVGTVVYEYVRRSLADLEVETEQRIEY